ncbi:MAG: 50S ribosomal protein L4 [Candidatus Levybacteria bacterium]|nr:50S ribosomal protein L4 [Candidatus Levybacteria bacterium]
MPAKPKSKIKSQKSKTNKKPVATIGTVKKPVRAAKGLTVDVYDIKGSVAGTISLPKEIFAAKVNSRLMTQAVRVYLANQRKGTVSTKTRGEVIGSTRKIYRQKGTGRARHGAITAPIFVGGGVVFGPKPRDYALKLPQKMKRAALFSAISAKVSDNAVRVIADLEKIAPKTKSMAALVDKLQLDSNKKVLLVLPQNVDNVLRAARNIPNIEIMHVTQLTTYKVLESVYILFMQQALDAFLKLRKKEEKQ